MMMIQQQQQENNFGSLKQELQNLLKERFNDYWRLLQTFLSAKLSKREFDIYIKQHLPGKVGLHNAFILSILSQAFSNTPAPDPFLHNRPLGPGKPEKKKSKKKTGDTLPIFSSTREGSGARNSRKIWIGRANRPRLVTRTKTPQLREIKQRMITVAEEEGLDNVDDGAAQLLQKALHAHLKRVLESSYPVKADLFAGGKGLKRRREDEEEEEMVEDVKLITRASLTVAVQKKGKILLRDDLPIQKERLLLGAPSY